MVIKKSRGVHSAIREMIYQIIWPIKKHEQLQKEVEKKNHGSNEIL